MAKSQEATDPILHKLDTLIRLQAKIAVNGMTEQRDRAKADAREKKLGGTDLSVYSAFRAQGVTKFTGYEELASEGRVLGLIVDGKDASVATVGQIAELGWAPVEDGGLRVEVRDGDKWARLDPHFGFKLAFSIDFGHPAIDATV